MKKRVRLFRVKLVSGATMVLIGLVFLMDNLGILDVAFTWPLVPIGVGVALLLAQIVDKTQFR